MMGKQGGTYSLPCGHSLERMDIHEVELNVQAWECRTCGAVVARADFFGWVEDLAEVLL